MKYKLALYGYICTALIAPVVVLAGDYGLGATAGAAGLNAYGGSLETTIGTVVGALLSLIGIIFFIMVLYGGIMWMTAAGNPETVKKSINTIISAAIGIIVVLSAYAITSFVLESVGTGASAPGTTTAATAPSTDNIGDTTQNCGGVTDACTDQQVCVSGVCVDNCVLPGPAPAPDATCMARSACSGAPAVGLCPGAVDWICCIK